MTDEFALDFGDLVVEASALAMPEQILLVGGAGAGKTHSALSLTEIDELTPMLYIDTEGSTVGVASKFDHDKVTVLRVKSHKDLKSVVDKVLANQDAYKTVVIDTIDTAQERAINLLQAGSSDGFEVWRKVGTWLMGNDGDGLMHKLKGASFLSVVVVHSREEKSESGSIIQKVLLQGSAKDKIASVPDVVIYQKRGQAKGDDGKIKAVTTVYTVGTKTFDQAKSRFDLPATMTDATLADVIREIQK